MFVLFIELFILIKIKNNKMPEALSNLQLCNYS